ncbi:MAG: hypothetical protein LBV79_02360 [Candidatus Adiutrix sp.]|nr:hypothetical protein [Candidatus Adiutrix sp.]
MKKMYAEILGNHAVELIRRTSGLTPTGLAISGQAEAPPEYELAIRIDFNGELADGSPISGYVLCGSPRFGQAYPLLASLARHFGLSPHLADSQRGSADILSEFLNIIIGLTGADWSGHGFNMEFSTPQNLSGQTFAPFAAGERAFHIAITTDGGPRVDLVAVFSG